MPVSDLGVTDLIWDIYARKNITNPAVTGQILSQWDVETEGSARLLKAMTANLSPSLWARLKSGERKKIMRELVRIDGGRGEIVKWLDAIIRQEDSLDVLRETAKWKPRGYAFPDVLLEAWKHKVDSHMGNGVQEIVDTGLEVIVEARLPSDTLPEHPEWKAWDERQRANTILGYLSSWKCNAKQLKILSRWEPSPCFDGTEIRLAIVRQWEALMSKVTGAEVSKPSPRKHYWKMDDSHYHEAVWKGLTGAARHYPGDEGWKIVLSWLRKWLVREYPLEVLEAMCNGYPPAGQLQEEWAAVWYSYLTSFPDFWNSTAWKIVGPHLSEMGKHNPRLAQLFANCPTIMQTQEMTRTDPAGKNPNGSGTKPPPWKDSILPELKWDVLRAEFMKNKDDYWLNLMTKYLLSLLTDVTGDESRHEEITETILEKLVTKIPSPSVEDILKEIREWESSQVTVPREGLFQEALQRLRQSPGWKDPVVRLVVMTQLTIRLQGDWQNGRQSPGLERLWLEIMHREEAQAVMDYAIGGRILNLKHAPPDVLREFMEIWKERAGADCPMMRQGAWIILKENEGDIAPLLARLWEEEKCLEVINAAAAWNPSPGEPLPPGFLEGWTACFQRLWAAAMQNGMTDYEATTLVCAMESVSKNLLKRWGDESGQGNCKNDGLDKIRLMWEMVEKELPPHLSTVKERVENNREGVEILLSLDIPPDMFRQKLEGKDTNCFFEIFADVIFSRQAFLSQKPEELGINARHNTGLIMVLGLRHRKECIQNQAWDTLQKLWGDLTWTPDQIPGGWELFCQLFRQNRNLKKRLLPGAIQMMCTVRHFSCRRDFRQILDNIRYSGDPSSAALAESALWREVATAVGTVMDLYGEPDRAGQRRWLREFILNWGWPPEGQEGQKSGRNVFVNVLWKSLFPYLMDRTKPESMKQKKRKVPILASREIVFCHPHGTAIGTLERPDGEQKTIKTISAGQIGTD